MCKDYTHNDMTFLKHILGQKIKCIRNEKSLSRKQWAVKKKIGLNTLTRLENGEGNATLDTILHVAIMLDVPVAELFTEIDLFRKTGYIPNTEISIEDLSL